MGVEFSPFGLVFSKCWCLFLLSEDKTADGAWSDSGGLVWERQLAGPEVV